MWPKAAHHACPNCCKPTPRPNPSASPAHEAIRNLSKESWESLQASFKAARCDSCLLLWSSPFVNTQQNCGRTTTLDPNYTYLNLISKSTTLDPPNYNFTYLNLKVHHTHQLQLPTQMSNSFRYCTHSHKSHCMLCIKKSDRRKDLLVSCARAQK